MEFHLSRRTDRRAITSRTGILSDFAPTESFVATSGIPAHARAR